MASASGLVVQASPVLFIARRGLGIWKHAGALFRAIVGPFDCETALPMCARSGVTPPPDDLCRWPVQRGGWLHRKWSWLPVPSWDRKDIECLLHGNRSSR